MNFCMAGRDVRATILHFIRKGKAMKVVSLALLLTASVAFVLLGCSDNSSPTAGPTDKALSPSSTSTGLAKSGAVGGSVSGEGRYFVSQSGANLGALYAARMVLSGVKSKDGNCSGKYEMDYLDFHNKVVNRIKGVIREIKFYGKVAMLWGDVQTDFYVDVFGPQVWRQIIVVTENGHGKSALLDRASNPWLTTDGIWPGEFDTFWALNAQDFLASIPASLGTEADYPLISGNFEVKEYH
jgi:hypothetical protein